MKPRFIPTLMTLMKPLPIQFIAIPVLLATITAMVLTARSKPEESAPEPKPAPPTLSRARKEASAVAALVRNSSREKPLTENVDLIQETDCNTDSLAEEFWSEHLSELQGDDSLSDRELGKKLTHVALNPQAPEWVRVEAMVDALVFTDDENYNQDIKPLAIRTNLPESINDVILEDLLIRPPCSVLPAAREIAKLSGHPLAEIFDEFVKSTEEDISSGAQIHRQDGDFR